MGQRSKHAALMDVKIYLRKEECALSTEQHKQGNYAALKDVKINLSEEESALGTDQKSNDAAVKGVQIKPRREECAEDTEQRSKYTYVTLKDAQIKVGKKGGVCQRHGAKVKRCKVDGCTNQAQKRGVCIRHGTNRSSSEVSTTYTHGSEFDKTTATLSNHHRGALAASASISQGQGSLPEEVVICQQVVVGTNYEEV